MGATERGLHGMDGVGLMLVLGFETSTTVSSVALANSQGVLGSVVVARGRGHVEFLVPAMQSLFGLTGIDMHSVEGVAAGIGPGLFTSMRVGIATAKTVAQTLGVPVVGISSLDLLAAGVGETSRDICACIDARRGQVFAAMYRRAPGGVERLDEYRALDPAALAGELRARAGKVLLVGDGVSAYPDDLSGLGDTAPSDRMSPTATTLVELALPRLERGEGIAPALIEPLYVRKSDAEIKWAERGVTIERPMRVMVSKSAREKSP